MKFNSIIKLCVLTLAALVPHGPTALYAEILEYDGLIEPYEVVEIGAPAEGIVAKISVDRSSPVLQGQVLVELESSVEHTAVEKAAVLAAFDGDIQIQKTHLAFAKRVYKRLKQLAAISDNDKDQAATEIALTRYRLGKARENLALAQLELKKSQAELNRRVIRSPITGVVVERYVAPGEYVNSRPLLRVARIDPLRVEVIVPSPVFGKIRPGMTATIVPELPGYGAQTATVTIVDRVIDSASSTFGVRLELPNPQLEMPSGLKCMVQFDTDASVDNGKKTHHRIIAGQRQKPDQD
jgi:RND family efflux transporter MFP subunit